MKDLIESSREPSQRLERIIAQVSFPQVKLSNEVLDVAKQFSAIRLNIPDASYAAGLLNNLAIPELNNKINGLYALWKESFDNAVRSPLVDWLSTFDFLPLSEILKRFELPDVSDFLKQMYLQAMYECHWFPYASELAGEKLMEEVSNILWSSSVKSKRRTARIDKAIQTYYSDSEIKKIKKRWNESDLPPYIRKMLSQTIDAHLRKEYALTVSCLATMWEMLINEKIPEKRHRNEELQREVKELTCENGYDEIFSDFYNMLSGACYSEADLIDGVPNRNGIAHGWYNKYPNKKASLNAILMTDFIIRLKPKESTEEN